ncbi:hypothetical protein NDQ41_07290 [Alcaligenes faecalis]|uniref:hypothetical protein n=1 Tax=Alcaligenes faecalis TaxID=511 RepID=UPI00203E3E98|nr:hypothetical protein [Alcaligenes faecalis]MCM2558502.1 hypothetical protein [Alcaligenes faecalis]MCM2621982.1 hypothetical protein [Alcaligenes faecalis]
MTLQKITQFITFDQLNKSLISIGLFCYFLLSLSPGLITTHLSFSIIKVWQIGLLAILAFSLLTSAIYLQVTQLLFYSLLFLCFIFLYPSLLGGIFGGFQIYQPNLPLDFFLTLIGIILISERHRNETNILSSKISKTLITFGFISFLLTVLIGGFQFLPYPKFIYEHGSSLIGREEDYSLPMTNWYIFLSLVSASLYNQQRSFSNLTYLFFSALFFFFAFLSGGRGELIIGALFLFFIFSIKNRCLVIIISIASAIFILVFGSVFYDSVSKLSVIDRFAILLSGNLSLRDVLLRQASDLLTDNPICLISGCGTSFFQYYNNYDLSLYPHNSIAEAIIIYGIPLVFLMAFFTILGMIKYHKKSQNLDLFLILFIYFFIVSLKSGYLMGSWFLISGIIFFISLNFFNDQKKLNNKDRAL